MNSTSKEIEIPSLSSNPEENATEYCHRAMDNCELLGLEDYGMFFAGTPAELAAEIAANTISEEPTKPAAPANTQAALALYVAQQKLYTDHRLAVKTLATMMLAAAGETIRSALINPTTGLMEKHPRNIAKYVRDTYGTPTSSTLTSLNEALKVKLVDPHKLDAHVAKMSVMFTKLNVAGQPKSNFDQITALKDSVHPHYAAAITAYETKVPEVRARTFAGLTEAMHEQLQNTSSMTMGQMYGSANAANATPPLDSSVAALITQVSALTAIVQAMQKPKKPSKGDHYCHVHGTNHTHNGNECKVMNGSAKAEYTNAQRSATNASSIVGTPGKA